MSNWRDFRDSLEPEQDPKPKLKLSMSQLPDKQLQPLDPLAPQSQDEGESSIQQT